MHIDVMQIIQGAREITEFPDHVVAAQTNLNDEAILRARNALPSAMIDAFLHPTTPSKPVFSACLLVQLDQHLPFLGTEGVGLLLLAPSLCLHLEEEGRLVDSTASAGTTAGDFHIDTKSTIARVPRATGEGVLVGIGSAIKRLDIVSGALIVLGEAEEVLLPTGEAAAEEDQQQP